jgi:hypothetical protein
MKKAGFWTSGALKSKMPGVFRALKFGAIIEAGLGVVAVVSVLAGGIGPCGPTGNVPFVVSFVHRPGGWMAGLLAEEYSPMHGLLTIVLTTMILSAVAYIFIELGRSRKTGGSV